MTYWNFQVWIAVKNCWATIQSSFQKCQLVFLRIGLMLSQLTIFFSTKLWTLGIAYHERSSSKRWGFNHHWNPELGALVLVHSRAQNHDKIQMVTVTRMPGSPPKKLLVDCKFSTIFFLLCMEYNYILKTIVGASSLRGITGEKRCFVFPVFFTNFRPSPPQNAQVFQVFFFFSLTRCLIHFLNSSSPLRKRAGWWDRISLLEIWWGEWKAREKVWITCFFSSFGYKKVSLQ